MLEQLGIITTEKMGNIIEPQKEYDEDTPLGGFLNGVENLKAAIDDTYINYLPFYAHIVTTVKNAKINMNKPINELLSALGQKALATPAGVTDVLEVPETGVEAETFAETAAAAETAAETAAVEEEKPHIVKHKYRYLTNRAARTFMSLMRSTRTGERCRLLR